MALNTLTTICRLYIPVLGTNSGLKIDPCGTSSQNGNWIYFMKQVIRYFFGCQIQHNHVIEKLALDKGHIAHNLCPIIFYSACSK